MPKKTPYPRLRVHVRKSVGGKVWTSYYYDRRPDGLKDEPLGNDYDAALLKWEEIHNNRARTTGTLQEAFTRWREEVLTTYESEVTKRGYRENLSKLEPAFGPATWDRIELPTLKDYLTRRTAKTRGNREVSLLSIIWNWARVVGLTKLHWPAAGMERSKWKNKERARTLEVTDALFDAVYAEAKPALRDAMDIASATGLRLTDVRLLLIPTAGQFWIRTSKRGKIAEIDVNASPVLTRLVAERRAKPSNALMLLVGPTGRAVSERMMRDWFAEARMAAAAKEENAGIRDQIEAMILRDMRKRAAGLAEDMEAASKLLQHGSTATTAKHYRKGDKLRPVR